MKAFDKAIAEVRSRKTCVGSIFFQTLFADFVVSYFDLFFALGCIVIMLSDLLLAPIVKPRRSSFSNKRPLSPDYLSVLSDCLSVQ